MALTELKRWGDGRGLDAITEAVTIRRELTGLNEITEDIIRRELSEARQAAFFLPDFARSLNDRAIWLGVVGRREEALDSIKQAITIRRQLAETLPAVYQRELNQSLHVLSVLQGERR
jgi:hypothetical protein